MKAIFAWTARHVLLFVLLALALAAFQLGLASSTADWIRGAGMTSTAEMTEQLAAKRSNVELQYERRLSRLREASISKRDAALKERQARLGEVNGALAEAPGLLDRYNPKAILERQTLQLEKRALEGEIAVLEGHALSTSLRSQLMKIRVPTQSSIAAATKDCRAANEAVREFNDQVVRLDQEARKLTNAARKECSGMRKLEKLRAKGLEQAAALQTRIRRANAEVGALERQGREAISSYEADPVKATVGDILRKAAIALLAIILLPFVIRTVFYFVLAPLAERRAEIRISVPGHGGGLINPSAPSRVSVPVVLSEEEELLVRQGYLQTSSLVGNKSTRWLLDYCHILSSIAAGLHFLTRIRGGGETTTISAVKDPLAELTEISIPSGSACVLHPRSLVGIIQPIDQPVRIHSHWRLFSLNAWLTMQLRFLSFHGPGRLVLKGGRGIRVERAEKGRIFGQNQLVGFSADLAYSVTRAETFAPYFFGKESLFRDKVRQGSGIVIIEEAPLAARRGKAVRSGLEGTFDGFLKAFGL